MIINDFYQNYLIETLIEDDKIEAEGHVSSGKLSASMLGEPVQWQFLKMFGFTKIVDPYLLGKFLRGKEVEKTFLDRLSRRMEVKDRQKKVEYRGVVGYMDAVVSTAGSPLPVGFVPFEVKSVSNAKFKRLTQEGKVQRGHALQGALYGLAEGYEFFDVAYVSGEDYRSLVFRLKVADYKEEIDKIIDAFNSAILSGEVPVFEPPEKWQANPKYSKFPEWMTLTKEECQKKLKEHLLEQLGLTEKIA